MGGGEGDQGVGGNRREGVVSKPWVCVRTEIKEQLQEAENIRQQEIRAKLTENATRILATFVGLQRDMKWEFCAANLKGP